MKIVLILVCMLFGRFVFSQSYQTVVEIDDTCGSTLGFMDNEEVELTVDRILDEVGMNRNFVIWACPDINNALAKILMDPKGLKERYIVYDPEFFDSINEKAKNDWAAIQVLAHEIGHHFYGHALNDLGSNHSFELEADRWSGFVLRRMGAGLKDTQSAIETIKLERATRTHPAKADRLAMIKEGWMNGERELDKFTPKDEITSERVLDKYFSAIGGKDVVTTIKTMSYTEKMVPENEVNKDRLKLEHVDIVDGFGEYTYIFLNQDAFIKESVSHGSKYISVDGQLYFKNKKKSNGPWIPGYPFQDNIYGDISEEDVRKNINTPFGGFDKQLQLLTNKDSIRFHVIKTVNGLPSYELEEQKKKKIQLKANRSLVVESKIVRYYNVDTGLLHTVIETRTEKELRKGKIKNSTVTKTETKVEGYSLEENLLFPHRFTLLETTSKNGLELPVKKFTRVISNIKLNPIVNADLFKVD